MSYSRKKTNGWLRTYFLEPPPVEFFIYLLYPWKFQIYQSFTPGNCAKLRYISLGNCKTKNRDPCKFHIIFSWSPLKIPHAFLCLIPLEIPYSQPRPTVWIFSGIAQCKEGVYFFFHLILGDISSILSLSVKKWEVGGRVGEGGRGSVGFCLTDKIR